ncbi:hypothetical protein DLB95_27325 [Salmonella enterica subsp. diarizonae]|uniref:Surface lipoprotein assembly modifier N-terminal TPR repeats region domain-containing protein n=3 Tax=Salmonella enterica TaxID=28901 RepID=A0A7U6BD30_SALDZ|nr:hypothetical protein [Salmonella enterica]ECI2309304.1 hypothetical protein [Salmonella enterica subsp. enterica serovar Infantis]EDW6120035.1 hypothetical protein [Salmonella enterica subsp. salamae]EDY2187234.1 hypothetical protein [Salmonella enterica subsp. enterica]EHQ9198468.1 hypothetical protein [Salmonella enterica subsp. diarizonae serovar 50:k:z:[z50],[z57],[z68], [z86]]AXC71987.1 hypothetical protein DOE59_10610 [Salmonella enterica subsp. diarizonae serovar 48:i:z]
MNNDSDGVENTLQYCEQCLKNIDPLFLEWADAILERRKKNYSESIRHYRKIISARPDWYSARLQLATVLYLNKDILSVKEQLRKLRSEALSQDTAGLIDRFIARIQKTDHWSFRGGFTYLNEKNINNVPPPPDELSENGDLENRSRVRGCCTGARQKKPFLFRIIFSVSPD